MDTDLVDFTVLLGRQTFQTISSYVKDYYKVLRAEGV